MSGSARKPPTDLGRVKMPELTALILAPTPCARDRLVGERSALINRLRAFLLECGPIMPQGPNTLEDARAFMARELATFVEVVRRTGVRLRP